MSEPLGADFHRMRRRSPRRLDALLMLSSMSEAYPRQLASAIEVDVSRLWQMVYGDGEDYAHEWSLHALGLVQIVEDEHRGRKLVITPRGRRKARQWAAALSRAALAREARRQANPAPRVHPRAPPAGGGAVPTPVATASFSWAFPAPAP